MIATLLALLKARWAPMKTRRLAMAEEKERVGARSAHAWGFVSRIIVKREGGGSVVVRMLVSICVVRRGEDLPSDVLL